MKKFVWTFCALLLFVISTLALFYMRRGYLPNTWDDYLSFFF